MASQAMTRVYLSLGSNIDREHNIRAGLDALAAQFGEVHLSPVYESEAVGFDGAPFLNLVARIDTGLPLGELAGLLRDIEADHGRVRGDKKFASRTLDIDVLTYGDLTGLVDGVELPRDEILKHAFVLRPLADLAPQARHPVLGETYAALLARLDMSAQKLWQVPFRWPA
ncbi:7, 8-Dihydro-6-hydroxymethylpterin-pyrophosphokinase, HPPK [Isoalcanivorax pacificus W11-5]|uniref:2-amino-4-hydroxy-6-hydroxymethyldihydropteridine diphosphokinase n=1 Tax=Isoalcanivorax pacificus W11-5 TaxID=391936 RepID=A0A0B4XSY0_9GAMM|nr:2-amino-4-hydroxy-6-hydroxymethyldihydropteridine diphosphokinase [Isoalcanivorax pacificus]AJD49412.1 7, 8-Dihydro-6-hydroxymethylpterin-pyrophosphokinase, HPPK [Isoalcanivorax pacificus W11-5]